MIDLHPRLIQANIALYQGDRAEALRLVQSYRAERTSRPEHDPNRGMMLWIEAQAQADTFVRIDALKTLVASVQDDDPYAQMARDYLQVEDHYHARLNPPRNRNRAYWMVSFVTLLIVGIIIAGVVISDMNNGDDDTSEDAEANTALQATIAPTPLPTRFPDRSQALTIADHTSRYPGGILEIVAYERESVRVLDDRLSTPVFPVQGAYFLALRVIFECRIGICNDPPEAEIHLRLESGDMISIREEVIIADEPSLEPVALGHTTTGWLVFELPVISEVDALVILPDERESDDEQAVIPLNLP